MEAYVPLCRTLYLLRCCARGGCARLRRGASRPLVVWPSLGVRPAGVAFVVGAGAVVPVRPRSLCVRAAVPPPPGFVFAV